MALNQTSSSVDFLEFRSKGDQLKIQNIKDILLNFSRWNLEYVNKHGHLVDAEFFKKHATWEPLYFSTHIECFEALKALFKPSNFLQIIDNYVESISSNTIIKYHLIEFTEKIRGRF